MYRYNGYFWLIGKDDNSGETLIFKSTTIDSNYERVIIKKYLEGIAEEGHKMIRLDNGKYRIYVDPIAEGKTITYLDFDNLGDEQPTNTGEITVTGYTKKLYHMDILDFNRPYSFEEF